MGNWIVSAESCLHLLSLSGNTRKGVNPQTSQAWFTEAGTRKCTFPPTSSNWTPTVLGVRIHLAILLPPSLTQTYCQKAASSVRGQNSIGQCKECLNQSEIRHNQHHLLFALRCLFARGETVAASHCHSQILCWTFCCQCHMSGFPVALKPRWICLEDLTNKPWVTKLKML